MEGISRVLRFPCRGLSGLLRRLWPLAALVGLHLLAVVSISMASGVPFDPAMSRTLGMLFTILLPLFGFVLVVRHFLYLAFVLRPARPLARFLDDLKALAGDTERIGRGMLALLLIVLFIGGFSHLKSLVPHLNPFSWDAVFAAWDRKLHFGRAPHEWLQMTVLARPLATTLLNAAYHFWFFLIYFVVVLACFSPREDTVGPVFLLAFVLTFAVGGNLLAVLFSSAGPVYYARLGFGEEFVPLMEMLAAFDRISPVWALEVQEALWRGHVAGGPLSGISAMPSMHVASATLIALYGARRGRWWGAASGLFALAIMVGSVQLGWHYAVDGYAGALLAVVFWCLSARLLGRRRAAGPARTEKGRAPAG